MAHPDLVVLILVSQAPLVGVIHRIVTAARQIAVAVHRVPMMTMPTLVTTPAVLIAAVDLLAAADSQTVMGFDPYSHVEARDYGVGISNNVGFRVQHENTGMSATVLIVEDE